MIDVQDLSFSYQNENKIHPVKVIDKISFNIPKSSLISVLGPSGSGKTTLLHCLCGLLQKYDGVIELDSKPPIEARNNHTIGLVSQKPIFFEWLNIFENIALPLKVAKKTKTNIVFYYLEKFGLDEYAFSFPHQLSGGMLARVALARVLVSEPKFILMDEAFNFLDEALREKINQDIQEYWIEKQPTILSVTHSISEAVFLSDKIIILSHKPATIVKIIEINFSRPRNASLLLDINFIERTNEIRSKLIGLYNGKK